MAYALASDVAALNKARVIGAGNNPTLADINTYLDLTAAEIDSVLINKGYQVPVASTNTGAWALLRNVNAQGGFALMEEASPGSQHADRARKAYEDSKKMLESAQQIMNAPKDETRAEPRGPWSTLTPTGQTYDPQQDAIGGVSGDGISAGFTNSPRLPYFSRTQRF